MKNGFLLFSIMVLAFFFMSCNKEDDIITEAPVVEEEASIFIDWMNYAMKDTSFQAANILENLTWYRLSEETKAAYNAPFPSRAYMTGVRVFPSLINEVDGLNEEAWAALSAYEKPFLSIWGFNDYGTMLGACEIQQ